jgi:hypothetical protein
LSIALLGSILIIASSTDDFGTCSTVFISAFSSSHFILGLDSKAPPGCPPFEWKYALRPNSFKTCLQQMVSATQNPSVSYSLTRFCSRSTTALRYLSHFLHLSSVSLIAKQAFRMADTSMESIKNNTSQMPGVITTLIDLVLHGTIQDIDDHFLNQVNDLLGKSQRCLAQAQKSADAFHHISGLFALFFFLFRNGL